MLKQGYFHKRQRALILKKFIPNKTLIRKRIHNDWNEMIVTHKLLDSNKIIVTHKLLDCKEMIVTHKLLDCNAMIVTH